MGVICLAARRAEVKLGSKSFWFKWFRPIWWQSGQRACAGSDGNGAKPVEGDEKRAVGPILTVAYVPQGPTRSQPHEPP